MATQPGDRALGEFKGPNYDLTLAVRYDATPKYLVTGHMTAAGGNQEVEYEFLLYAAAVQTIMLFADVSLRALESAAAEPLSAKAA